MSKEYQELVDKIIALKARLREKINHLETQKHHPSFGGEANLWHRDALEDVITSLDDMFSDPTTTRPMNAIKSSYPEQ